MISKIIILVLLIALGLILFGKKVSESFGLVEVKGYKVYDDYTDPLRAAEKLSRLDKTAHDFISKLVKKYPADPRIIRLAKNYRSQALREGKPIPGTTSYTENKGEKIVMCLRSKKGELHDANTLTFVFLHELSHIATESYGHGNDFWENFRFILEEATSMGYYKAENYNARPVDYCGMSIYSSPLFN